MPDNQRQIEREERRLRKDRRNKIIIWSVIAIVVVILVIMRVCEININTVKSRFTGENGNISFTDGVADDNFPYSIDSSDNVIMTNVNNRLGVLTPSSFTIISSTNGETEYVFEHGFSNPVFSHSGVYTLVYDQGSKNYRVDTTSGLVYEKAADSSIFCADVNKNGYVALATASKSKRCDIVVYNDSLDTLFELSTSIGYPINIALSDNGKRLALATVESENAELVTTVSIYNVRSGNAEASVKLPSSSLVDMKYNSSGIMIVGDNYAGVIKGDEYKETFKIGTASTVCYDFTPSGDLVIVHNEFDNSTANVLSVVKPNGKIKTDININGNVKDVSASSSVVAVLTNNKIYSFASGSGNEKGVASCDDSVKSICRLGSENFCHKQSIIEKSEAEAN